MFRKVSRWLTDKSDQFVRGGSPQPVQEQADYDMNQGFTDAYATADTARRKMMDPFGDGDKKYGGRQPYRSRAQIEAEAAQQQAQQEAETYRAQQEAYQAQQEAYQAQQAQYQEQMQQTGTYQAQSYQQPQQGQYQEQMQQTGTYQAQGYQQPQQGQYQEQMQQTGTYQAQGYQQPQQEQYQEQMQQTGTWQAQQYQQPQQPMGNVYSQQGYAAQGSNVVTFPGMQTSPDGMVYAHVEYIVQLCSRNECRTVIDYIRSNASVFLNMEMIANASERQRCVDMLSGAAYALGCALNKISPRGVYLISSPSVRVMMDNATQKLAATPEVRSFARQSYDQEPAQSRYTSQQPVTQPAPEEPQEAPQTGGFSSGSPTQRFQSQGAQGMPVSFSTAMAGSHTSMSRAINAQRYNAQ